MVVAILSAAPGGGVAVAGVLMPVCRASICPARGELVLRQLMPDQPQAHFALLVPVGDGDVGIRSALGAMIPQAIDPLVPELDPLPP